MRGFSVGNCGVNSSSRDGARGTVTEVDSDRSSADQEKSVFGGLSRSGVCVVYMCVHLKAVGQCLS